MISWASVKYSYNINESGVSFRFSKSKLTFQILIITVSSLSVMSAFAIYVILSSQPNILIALFKIG